MKDGACGSCLHQVYSQEGGGRVRSACFLLLTQSGTSRMALHTFKAGPSLVKPFPEVGLLGDSKAHQAEKINHHSILKRVLNIAV